MTVHLIKLCVGATSVADLEAWQRRVMERRRRDGEPPLPTHVTRMTPKRADELLLGGSLYWVIKGRILARQPILGLDGVRDGEGRPACRITLDPALSLTQPTPRKAFQGWRYLAEEDAPEDASRIVGGGDLPAALREELLALGAW